MALKLESICNVENSTKKKQLRREEKLKEYGKESIRNFEEFLEVAKNLKYQEDIREKLAENCKNPNQDEYPQNWNYSEKCENLKKEYPDDIDFIIKELKEQIETYLYRCAVSTGASPLITRQRKEEVEMERHLVHNLQYFVDKAGYLIENVEEITGVPARELLGESHCHHIIHTDFSNIWRLSLALGVSVRDLVSIDIDSERYNYEIAIAFVKKLKAMTIQGQIHWENKICLNNSELLEDQKRLLDSYVEIGLFDKINDEYKYTTFFKFAKDVCNLKSITVAKKVMDNTDIVLVGYSVPWDEKERVTYDLIFVKTDGKKAEQVIFDCSDPNHTSAYEVVKLAKCVWEQQEDMSLSPDNKEFMLKFLEI